MRGARLAALVTLTMVAFAANSLLCREALRNTRIDASTFTLIRLASGAVALWLIARRGDRTRVDASNWTSAFALFAYAAAFSYAYVTLPAGTGALLLFGAVQATMIGWGLWRGERFNAGQLAGLLVAFAGLTGLVLPGVTAPAPLGSLLMLAAGAAWGVYSLRGRGAGDATRTSAGNFLRSVPFALALGAATVPWLSPDPAGAAYALVSGAVTSALGYILWYVALKSLTASHAATVQLSVPVIAALGGVAFLGEHVTLRLVLAAAAILGGIALVILGRRPEARPGRSG